MIKKTLLILVLIVAGAFGYTKVMAKVGRTSDIPTPVAIDQQVDTIRVFKSERRMELLRDGEVMHTYRIALGNAGNEGHKQREGDEKTPEGKYVIDWRNPKSMAHLSLHISYPNKQDSEAAKQAGYSPGGNIMIHGLPNGWGWLGPIHHVWDWTDGCIAVTNEEMREIWSKVPDGTPIEIKA